VSAAEFTSPARIPESKERRAVWLLCAAAAVHVFIFSAAFPFFNNADEPSHFDLVVKYARGHLPRGVGPVSDASRQFLTAFGSPEFLMSPNTFAGGQFPAPAWKPPAETAAPPSKGPSGQGDMLWQLLTQKTWQNYETSQPPLYYALAALWWRAGESVGLAGAHLLYWLRFLNIFFVAALVWVGWRAARLVFPDRPFFRLGLPALLAFFPQTAFYSVQNDVLSPLCFGAVCVCLAHWWRVENPGAGLGAAMGLALAATYLAKLSNLPLLAVAGMALLGKFLILIKTGKWRPSLPGALMLVLCAGLPVGAWLWWSKHAFGDFTGSAAKIQFLGWTYKPFGEWWHHPLFTPWGSWLFLSGLLAAFWQGEFLWHGQALDQPGVDAIYFVLSFAFVIFAVAGLLARTAAPGHQRRALWFSLASLLAAVAFLALLSIMFDFGNCVSPSRDHPYFTHGRLLLGALIPFGLLLLAGMDFLLRGADKVRWRSGALVALIAFMLAAEIITDRTVFASQYNWFHL
jgi:hypothetical protein